MSTEAKVLQSLTKPAPQAGADVVATNKDRATGSTHFGDGDFDAHQAEEIQGESFP